MAEATKINDMTFLFLMLHAPKSGNARFQVAADILGLPSAKAAESRYYRLKKAHWDTVGGAELLLKCSTTTPVKPEKGATPKSKKHQLEGDRDDEVSASKKKGKGSAKKMKAGDGDDEAPTKVEPGAEDAFT
ncbi:hypothetical protein LTR91_006999 [Friedmanniomyces endolithicus]|uniref:Uncharacterized protein n=1 Tax=Friedmanniomyces endolithicus TaxID=329885 RepID=A0AAN6KSF4_9PEZI|nr:hypothetical protein LTR94_004935 [Friedmanniomyces endolithicus]KAK0803798.1 hypothetical protein LTR59_004585 [Friedmanniomyces endolithicus]KAK0810107.1 hypothetical protein LTR38_004062 [Friedmanniomyces endolithicus]KAK0814170.1 hypothetical protein LTR75_004339 [Friedmanniomyces endolithicus]KAK0843775.1 hypothetical protein LTR03_008434 [Friedmanniomyces endolithicus]